MLTTGCIAIPIADRFASNETARKEQFEAYWNSTIGQFRDVPSYHKEVLLETRIIDDDSIEYVLHQKYNCKIAMVVSRRNSVVTSWHYVGVPAACWEYFPSGF